METPTPWVKAFSLAYGVGFRPAQTSAHRRPAPAAAARAHPVRADGLGRRDPYRRRRSGRDRAEDLPGAAIHLANLGEFDFTNFS